MKKPLSIKDANCPAWYRRYVEGKRVTTPRKPRPRGRLCTRGIRNRTGCIGISLVSTANGKCDGRPRLFFAAHAGGTNRKYSIDTLGRQEAFRRAVAFRAEYELSLRRQKEKEAANG